jgi:hypothetical protein
MNETVRELARPLTDAECSESIYTKYRRAAQRGNGRIRAAIACLALLLSGSAVVHFIGIWARLVVCQ